MSVEIRVGDCRESIRALADESVHCVVTSPPYFGLRDYGTATWEGGDPACDHQQGRPGAGRADGVVDDRAQRNRDGVGSMGGDCKRCGAKRTDSQIGLEATPDAFVAEIVAVFAEVRRVLRSDGVVFLNLGDSYMGNGPRQTGRNDTNRETPGGRGGSFRGGVRRAIACDTPDKEPEDFQERDCLCGSLCDVCREAYRSGIFRSESLRVPTRCASTPASSLGHTVSASDHLPTSGLATPAGRIADATLGRTQDADHEAEPPHGALESTNPEYAGQPLGPHLLASSPDGECLLCGRSLPDYVQACAGRSAAPSVPRSTSSATHHRNSIADIASIGDALAGRKSGRAFDFGLLKPKDLIGIPWAVAFALRADGWFLRQDLIWSKPNPMPESVTDRCTKAHEYLFLLAKSERYHFDAEAIKEPAIHEGRVVKATGDGAQNAQKGEFGRTASGFTVHDTLVTDRNKRSVWTVATQPFSEAHFATFPPALIEPCILAGCPKGGTVLDPFGGAGTTGLVADRLGRNAVLLELNPEYAEMARRRIRGDSPLFADVKAIA